MRQRADVLWPPSTRSSLFRQLQRVKSGVTLHGFRSTFRDWATDETHYPHEVAESAPARAVANQAETAAEANSLPSGVGRRRHGRGFARGSRAAARGPEADRSTAASMSPS